jgi:hypothetical protein
MMNGVNICTQKRCNILRKGRILRWKLDWFMAFLRYVLILYVFLMPIIYVLAIVIYENDFLINDEISNNIGFMGIIK